jgi:hypothetical protein
MSPAAIASSFTSASPWPGLGSGMSETASASGAPKRENVIAFTTVTLF